MIVEPFNPKLIPLLSLNTTLSRFPLVVPAEKLTGAAAAVPPEMTTLPPVIPTETFPAPLKINDDALVVPELL